MTEGLYFGVIVFFLEKSVNENWRETLIGWGNQDVWREPKLMSSPTKQWLHVASGGDDFRWKESAYQLFTKKKIMRIIIPTNPDSNNIIFNPTGIAAIGSWHFTSSGLRTPHLTQKSFSGKLLNHVLLRMTGKKLRPDILKIIDAFMSERMYSLLHLGHEHRISQVASFKKPAFLISVMSRIRNQDITQ